MIRPIASALVLAALLSGALGPPALAAARAEYAWDVGIVDPDALLYGSSAIVLEPSGRAVIAYASVGVGLRIAREDPGGWTIEDVPGTDGASGVVSLALDVGNRPHLAFVDADTGEVRYATHDGLSWRLTTIDSTHVEGSASLALNATGAPHVAYPGSTGDLRHAFLSGGAWTVQVADPNVVIARHPSLAFDRIGRPVVAYYGNGNLQVASWIGFRWDVVSADPGASPQSVSLAIDSADTPIVGYGADPEPEPEREARLASWNGTAWVRSVVDTNGDVGWDTRMALDSAGNPHLSYYDRTTGLLRHATWEATGWSVHVVDVTRIAGWYSSLVVDASDAPHFAYFSWEERAVRYAVGGTGIGVRTWPARAVTPTSARLVGEVTSLGGEAAVGTALEWRLAGGGWQRVPGPILTGPGFIEHDLVGLPTNTTLEYRAVAVVNGTDHFGAAQTFRTPTPAPNVFPFEWIAIGVAGVAVTILGYVLWTARKRRASGR
jgi:hypothetical protein